MLQPQLSKLALVTGVAMTAVGAAAFSQLGWISTALKRPLAMNLVVIASLTLTLVGILVAIVASVFWSRHAEVKIVVTIGLVTGGIALSVYLFANVNVHGPSFILAPIMMGCALESLLLFLTAGMRANSHS